MALILNLPEGPDTPHLRPRITVMGVGGAGGNAINNMIESNLSGVDFVVANTDAQALSLSRTSRRIQLGTDVTQGLGAGAQPEVGRAAAEEAHDLIAAELEGAHMAFITAGMGGGTGTGAAPVVAKIARDMGILTVGVVTKPFQFEGAHRMRIGETGIDELAREVDTLIIIPNQNLFHIANERTTFADAFRLADDVLYSGVRSITDLMINPGLINLDFADVRRVMQNMGRAMMGTGEADGERRALDAAEAAIANPLLEDNSMRGAQGVLINIIGGPDLTLYEADEAANRIREEVESDALIIVGSTLDESLAGRIRVSVVAAGINTGFGQGAMPTTSAQQQPVAPAYAAPYQPVASEMPTTTRQVQASMVAPSPSVHQRPAVASQRPVQPQTTAPMPPQPQTQTAPQMQPQTQPQPQAVPQPQMQPRQAEHAPILPEPKSREVVKILEELVLETHSRRETTGQPDPVPAAPQRVAQQAAPRPLPPQTQFVAHPATAPHAPQDTPRYATPRGAADQSPVGNGYSGDQQYQVAGANALHPAPESFPPPLPTTVHRPSPAPAPAPALRAREPAAPKIRETASAKPARGSGLLGMFGLGRSSAARNQEASGPKVIAKSLSQTAEAPLEAPSPEQNPEIPAFLRRQAN